MSDEGSPEGLPARLLTDLKRAASALMRARSVDVITHIDADGITAGAIAAETLENARRFNEGLDLGAAECRA